MPGRRYPIAPFGFQLPEFMPRDMGELDLAPLGPNDLSQSTEPPLPMQPWKDRLGPAQQFYQMEPPPTPEQVEAQNRWFWEQVQRLRGQHKPEHPTGPGVFGGIPRGGGY